MRRWGSWGALFLLWLVCAAPTFAAEPAVRWSVWEDRSGALPLGEVQARGAEFRPATQRLLNPGYSTSAWWLRLDVDVPAGAAGEPWERWVVLGSARLPQVQLWTPTAAGWQRQEAGTTVPHARWPLDTPTASFAVQLPAGQPGSVYLRVAGPTALVLDAAVCKPRDCQRDQAARLALGSAITAFLAVVVMGCLAMAGMLRQPAALTVAGFSLVYGLYELAEQGLAFQYLWPESTGWATRGLIPLIALTHMMRALVLYALVAGDLPQRWLRWLMLALVALYPPIVAAGCWYEPRVVGPVVLPLMVVGVLLGPALAWMAWWRGARHGLPVAMLLTLTLLASLTRFAEATELLSPSVFTLYLVPAVSVFSGLAMLAILLSHMRKLDREGAATLAMLEENRKSQAQRARLLAYIGHDLRAPLVTTLSHLRELEPARDTPQRAARSGIERSVAHQLELIDELVAHARCETDQLDLVPTACFLHGLLHEVAEQGRGLAGLRGNRFEARIAAELPEVVAVDAKRLRQLLLNLLSNAAKYTHGGCIGLFAGLEPGQPGAPGRLRCEVVDEGPGIAAADLPRIFEPFWRAPDQAGKPGTGLGLAIALQLAQAMGGTIEVSSQPGQGSRFLLTLPLSTAAAGEVAWPSLAADAPRPLGRGSLALVIDPDAGCTEHLAELLYAAEFDVRSIADGGQAAAMLAELRPALVIVGDVGAEPAGQLLRACRAQLEPPVAVLYTGRPQPAGVPAEPDFTARCLKPMTGPAWWSLLNDLMSPPALSEGKEAHSLASTVTLAGAS
ncbi:ATP-binding protein [Roseateles sp. DC23W]|uniref:histidine kinase n=1 Tax=Pelomonas dachongensis TaxID=3299029 RepID=A0ABW7EJ54_9BURK